MALGPGKYDDVCTKVREMVGLSGDDVPTRHATRTPHTPTTAKPMVRARVATIRVEHP